VEEGVRGVSDLVGVGVVVALFVFVVTQSILKFVI
jgi:hypothetical protein